MADLNELLKSKKVNEFIRQEKSRPWTVDRTPTESNTESVNPVRTEAQPGQNQVPNPVRTEAQPGQNRVAQSLKKTSPKANPVRTEAQTRSRSEANPVRTEAQSGQKIRDHNTLVGNDRNVMLALFLAAQRRGSVETSTFSRQALASQLGLSYEAARSSIKRLLQFGILEKVESSKGGPGAWVLVRFSQRVFQEINLTESKLSQNQVTNRVKSESELSRQPGQTLSSSSSSLILKETTTTREDFRIPLEVRTLGLTASSFSKSPLSASEIESSLEAFANDLRKKKVRAKSSPQALIVSVLNQGRPYVSADFAEALASDVKLVLEREKQVEELKQQQVSLQQLLEFEEFRRRVSQPELEKVVPRADVVSDALYERLIKAAFLDGKFR